MRPIQTIASMGSTPEEAQTKRWMYSVLSVLLSMGLFGEDRKLDGIRAALGPQSKLCSSSLTSPCPQSHSTGENTVPSPPALTTNHRENPTRRSVCRSPRLCCLDEIE